VQNAAESIPSPARRSTSKSSWLALAAVAVAVFGAGFALQFFVIADGGDASPSGPLEPGTFVLDRPAVLAQHSGKVDLLEPPNRRLPATIGQVAAEGTLVRLDGDARATFLAENGALVFTPAGVEVREEPARLVPELADVWKEIVPYHRTAQERFDEILTSKRLANLANGLEIDAPYGTVFDARPFFAWRDKDDAYPYEVTVRAAGATEPLWRRSVAAPDKSQMRVRHPEEEPALPRGEALEWTIASKDGRTVEGRFRLATAEETSSIRDAITKVGNTLPDLSVGAFFLAHAFRQRGCPQLSHHFLDTVALKSPGQRYPLEQQALIRLEAGHPLAARVLVQKLESMPMPIPLEVEYVDPSAGTGRGPAGSGEAAPADAAAR
jgi:hypothetical protein